MIHQVTGLHLTSATKEYMLRLGTDGGWGFDLEGPVDIESAELGLVSVRMSEVPETLPPEIAALIGQRVDSIGWSEDGDLTIVLERSRLHARPTPKYESWQLYGPGGYMVVCGPSGENL